MSNGIDQLTVSKINNQWHVTYAGKLGREVARLFGTATLPTAYGGEMSEQQVMAELSRMNDGVVIVGEER